MYKLIIKPILFLFAPEKAHNIVFSIVKIMSSIPFAKHAMSAFYSYECKPTNVLGIQFPNKVGLAAGLDKNAVLYTELGQLGFGFVEIGTITPKAQPGNPKPRLFRLPKDLGLINRMGFNNDGIEGAIERLKDRKSDLIIGGNIGKNKSTPNEKAVDDYVACFNALHNYVDYFVVNVSSPNTPNLRALQEKGPLLEILNELVFLNQQKQKTKPILLKIAPDLTVGQLDDIVDIVRESKIDGVIATNTTLSRDNLITPKFKVDAIGAGGLSGKPVNSLSTQVIKYLHDKSEGAFPIIGVGGIHSADDAIEKLKAGASLVQIYTGFIYEGPGLVKRINKRIEAEGI